MDPASYGPRFESNPLVDDAPEVWGALIESLAPATMLVAIQHRMGRVLLEQVSAEDIWQETLLHVWRDRAQCEWRGLAALKRWVLGVAENRIRNEADRIACQKRGGGATPLALDARPPGALPPPVSSTTPSRVASYVEEADLMRRALGALPEDLRDVVRLRHFEEEPIERIAERLSIGPSAVKYRFRKGAALYQAHVQELLGRRATGSIGRDG